MKRNQKCLKCKYCADNWYSHDGENNYAEIGCTKGGKFIIKKLPDRSDYPKDCPENK